MNTPKSSPYSIILLSILFLFAGCSKQEQETIRIGVNPWPSHEYLFLGKEKGFFEDDNLSIELVEYSSSGDLLRAFEWGQVQGMVCTATEILLANSHTYDPLQVFLVMAYTEGTEVILGPKDCTSLADIKGRKIGVDTGSLGIYVLARALEQEGLKLGDIKIIPVNPMYMPSMIKNGTIEVAVCYQPFSHQIQKEGEYNVLFASSQIPGELFNMLALKKTTLEKNPGQVTQLMKIWKRILDFEKANTQEVHAFMARREHTTLEDFESSLEKIKVITLEEQPPLLAPEGLVKASLDRTESTLRYIGLLEEAIPTQELITESPLSMALSSSSSL
tara:strand:+ start:13226 stop:14221 length:996 start_codon:yes stop_codon:yes gene_type:complete